MMKRLFLYICMVSGLFYQNMQALTVNVYVHGTQQFGSKMLPEDIWYCEQGLHHISHLSDDSMMVKDAQLMHDYEQTWKARIQNDPIVRRLSSQSDRFEQKKNSLEFDIDHYYTFGWSGQLSFDAREQAGNALYQELKILLQKYKQEYAVYPKLRIITFSHGGNVALNMVKNLPYLDGEKVELDLVLIACPVQKVTEYLINNPFISGSYVIYSTWDLLQVADYYTYNGNTYFPNRTFDTKTTNCYQILVSVNNTSLSHIELCHAFMRHIPKVLQATRRKDRLPWTFTKYDIRDDGFVFYNVFNMLSVMRAERKL